MQIMPKEALRLVAGVLATFMLILFPALSTPAASRGEENAEVTRLLADAREKAAALSKDADDMESMTRTDASWQSHAMMLETVKEHVNDLGRTMEKLNAARDSASDWQKQAIDRAMPLMKDLAANTTAAINHLNQNKTRPTSGSYAEYLKENAETAHQLSDLISSFVRYGDTRARLDKLEHRLEIASR
ncbi:MAG: hypothetical protein JWQ87_4887 [Candidatus Sulfotelmatobacter sp.]|nr:hypothetical protein [Candidatus Sulfotelmatobacter sp.]